MSAIRSYTESYHHARASCSLGVPMFNLTAGQPNIATSPWSLAEDSFPLLDLGNAAPCTSFEELGSAVALGRRERLKTPVRQTLAGMYSTFRPHGCSVPYFPPSRACQTLKRYSTVIIYGDSMMRHTTQGLLSLLTGDLAHGAAPLLASWSKEDSQMVYHACACDAQFSEDRLCRRWEDEAAKPNDSSMNSTGPLWWLFNLSSTHHTLRAHRGGLSSHGTTHQVRVR